MAETIHIPVGRPRAVKAANDDLPPLRFNWRLALALSATAAFWAIMGAVFVGVILPTVQDAWAAIQSLA